MNKPLKLIPIGNSTGLIIPKEMLQDLVLGQGDEVFPGRKPTGIELRASDPDLEREMAIAREVMKRRWSALRELAK